MNHWLDAFVDALSSPLAVLGFIGQALFFSRWIVQWAVSEKRGESIVPVTFWWLSLTGGILMWLYAFMRHDPVFLLGQTIGVANYGRNIVLIYRRRARKEIS